jgi:hypothetical protein
MWHFIFLNIFYCCIIVRIYQFEYHIQVCYVYYIDEDNIFGMKNSAKVCGSWLDMLLDLGMIAIVALEI